MRDRRPCVPRLVAVWLALALGVLGPTLVLGIPANQAVAVTPTSFSFGMVGDQGADAPAIQVLDAIGKEGLDLFQNAGDLSYGQTTPAEWCALVKSKVTAPFLIVAGNHESRDQTSFTAIEDYT